MESGCSPPGVFRSELMMPLVRILQPPRPGIKKTIVVILLPVALALFSCDELSSPSSRKSREPSSKAGQDHRIRDLFIPRNSEKKDSKNSIALEIPVGEGDFLSARFFFAKDPRTLPRYTTPVFLAFHGNGEIADDYSYFARDFHQIPADLLVVDYRGYGWSSGEPSVPAMNQDAIAVSDFFIEVFLKDLRHTGKRFLFGRSLGSVPATRVAHRRSNHYQGLVIESGIARAQELIEHLRLQDRYGSLSDDLSNTDLMKEVSIPVLFLHGERDTLIPPKHAKTNYQAVSHSRKKLVLIPEAGHSNVMVFRDPYYGAIRKWIKN